jgi:LytS/YehU family sensor histidine kinase
LKEVPSRTIALAQRRGGHRYLSKDLETLARLAACVAEQADQIRHTELQRLVFEAELRALQEQIHPHFLFNAFNTLYGVIPRQATEARTMLLNLAKIFRYFLQSEKPCLYVEEELQVIEAYLAI